MSRKACGCGLNEACSKCDSKVFQKIERSVPKLSYEIMEGGLKHLQGQVLTVVEATVPADKLSSAKSLVRTFFNEKLTLWFDLYGRDSELETPNYDKE